MSVTSTPLQLRQSAAARWIGVGVLAAVVIGLAVWHANSPSSLPTSDTPIVASTPAGQPIFIGVFAPGDDFGRRLALSGVKVHTTSNVDLSVVPWLCVGGAIGVTSEPEQFCRELVNPEGRPLGTGDGIVLEISSEVPAIAVIDRVRLGYREGLQWDTLEAGAPAVVSVLAR
jgi:hypothetical protein